MVPTVKKIIRLPRYLLLGCIFLYQKFFSPDHSVWAKKIYPHGYCKYYPTCSKYGYEVVKKYGLIIGVPKMVWRIMRCNPWSRGGVDMPQ